LSSAPSDTEGHVTFPGAYPLVGDHAWTAAMNASDTGKLVSSIMALT
jgi:hypothetical protein